MILTITGHRPERIKGKEKEIKNWIREQLLSLKPEKVISGMAKGVDQIFCDVAIELNIPLVCAFPYKHNLSESERKYVEYSSETRYQTETWYKECYTERDRWMVDNADTILVVWDGIPSGGTFYTKCYAVRKQKNIINCPLWKQRLENN